MAQLCKTRTTLLFLHGSLVSLASKGPDTPVACRYILGIEIVQVPSQTPESVLTWLEQDIHFTANSLCDPIHVTLHVVLGVSGANDGDLCFQQWVDGFLPLVRGSGMSETWVEKHKSIKVRIVWGELLSFMQSVEVLDKGGDLHLRTKSVFDDGTEGVCRGAFGKRELGIAVGHALRANEDEVESGAGEDVGELEPDFTRKR